ncbi:MAG: sigma-54-dependent Fis family transcriptional regulator, partial [Proteobacteria bacterium]|nr:sigma-54-dependent Fis family transcriptional regulator [Pseudomonadota bacterium]
ARASHAGSTTLGISDEAMRWLCKREWPGNVRELANVVERAVALTDHDTIVLEDVRAPGNPTPAEDASLGEAADRLRPLADVELAYIRKIVERVDGNMAQAARVLGIDRRTLYRKLAT